MNSEYLTYETDALLDNFIDSALHPVNPYSPNHKPTHNSTTSTLPPRPTLPDTMFYIMDEKTEQPKGPFSAAQIHSWSGSGQLDQYTPVHDVNGDVDDPDYQGWVPLAEADLCDHRWYCRDTTVSEEIQGPFTPLQVRKWFAEGDLYWQYANHTSGRGVPNETDAWYYMDDDEKAQGPFPFFELRAWFCSGLMSSSRLIIHEHSDEWRAAESFGLGTSMWFLIDSSDAVCGPMSALQVHRWFATGWLEEWLYEAAGGSDEEDMANENEEDVNAFDDDDMEMYDLDYDVNDYASNGYDVNDYATDDPNDPAAWFYIDDVNAIQGPFTSAKMDEWFATGILNYLQRWVAYEQSDFVPASETALYVEEYDRWYIRDWPEDSSQSEIYGPFSAQDLIDMVDERLITLFHEVALEGTKEWNYLGDYLTSLSEREEYEQQLEQPEQEQNEQERYELYKQQYEQQQYEQQQYEQQQYEQYEQYEQQPDNVPIVGMEDKVFYYNDTDGSIVGPYTFEELRNMYKRGVLSPEEHWVCLEGDDDWFEASDFGLVAGSWDYGGWLVLTSSIGEIDGGEQIHGPYLWSEIAMYCDGGLLGQDVLVSSGEHDWMTPKEAGMILDEEDEEDENDNNEDNEDQEDALSSSMVARLKRSGWYVLDEESEGRSVGPYPLKDLIAWASSGGMDASAFVLSEVEGSTWKKFEDVISEMANSLRENEHENNNENDTENDTENENEMDQTYDYGSEEDSSVVNETATEDEEDEDEDYDDYESENESENESETESSGEKMWYMLNDTNELLGPFPTYHLADWYEKGHLHGDREVVMQGDESEEWIRLKTMLFRNTREQAHGTGAEPSSTGRLTDLKSGEGAKTLERGPMYASNINF